MTTLAAVFLMVFAQAGPAGEALARFRVTGLFQPDRVEDLRKQAGKLVMKDGNSTSEARIIGIDYENAIVTFGYDPNSPAFRNRKPDQVRERLNNAVREASRGTFGLHPAGTLDAGKLREVRISVAGLDCKGCAYGAYRAIANIEGVQSAVVHFREGYVKAMVDPSKTDRAALAAALRKAQVDVTEP